MKIKWKCPFCRKVASAPEHAAGAIGTCRKCGEPQVVPWDACDSPANLPENTDVFDFSRVYGVRLSGSLAVADDEAVASLLDCLDDSDSCHDAAWTVTHLAALRLWDLRESPVVEALQDRLVDDRHKVQWKSAEALGEIGAQRSVQPLVEGANRADDAIRLYIVEALEKIQGGGPDAATEISADSDFDRVAVEVSLIMHEGDEALGWGCPNFAHIRLYRRAVRVLRSGDENKDRVALWWYAGRFGLACGVSPEKCIEYFHRGIALSPDKYHSIRADCYGLTYLTAVLRNDKEAVAKAQREAKENEDVFGGRDLRDNCDHLILHSVSLPQNLLERD